MSSNLQFHCELAQYILSTRCDLYIDLKVNSHTLRFRFFDAPNALLKRMYRNQRTFFRKLRNVLREYLLIAEKQGVHYAWVQCDVLRISPWVLEMCYRERGIKPRRYNLEQLHNIIFDVARTQGVLSAAEIDDDKKLVPKWIYFIQVEDKTRAECEAAAAGALGRLPGTVFCILHRDMNFVNLD